MLKLMKYELKKRKKSLIVGAIALVVAEGLALYFLNKQGNYVVLAIVIMGLMLAGAVLLAFLDVAVNYYNDFKKSQGTLLFLTPNSGHKIVGSKMIFGALELLVGLLIVLLFTWLTNSVAINLGYEGIGPQIAQFKELLNFGVGSQNTWWVITGFSFLVFLQYLASQSIAVSSVTIGRTVMSRNSYNWLAAVLIFLVVSFIIQTVNGGILFLIGMSDGVFSASFVNVGGSNDVPVDAIQNVWKYLVAGGLQYLFWIITSFVVSSTLLNKKIDI